jgi:hypothetical protein
MPPKTKITIRDRDIHEQLSAPRAPPRSPIDYSNLENLANLQNKEQTKRLSEAYAALTGNYTNAFKLDANDRQWQDLVACPNSVTCINGCSSSTPPSHRPADLMDLPPLTKIKITWTDPREGEGQGGGPKSGTQKFDLYDPASLAMEL